MTTLDQGMHVNTISHRVLRDQYLSEFSTFEIRQAIANLVEANRIDLANALSAAGQSLFPESEEILVISALLAEIQQDWTGAEKMLRKIVCAQGAAATPSTWHHLIRVLRCQFETGEALEIAQLAIKAYPSNLTLNEEFLQLQELLTKKDSLSSVNKSH